MQSLIAQESWPATSLDRISKRYTRTSKYMIFVLRQPAVQDVQLARTSDELLCGKYIWSKSKCKNEIKLQQLGENDEQASPKTMTSVFASETTSC